MPKAPKHIVQEAYEEESGAGKTPNFVSMQMIKTIHAKYAAYADEVLETRVSIMNDTANRPEVRLTAARDIENRYLGTPVSTTNLNMETNPDSMFNKEKLDSLPQDQLYQTIETVRALVDQVNGGDMIDISEDQNES